MNLHIFFQNVLPQTLGNLPLLLLPQKWFMHGGAPSHFSIIGRDQFNAYQNRSIGHGAPGLNPFDYYLWRHLKQLVYSKGFKSYRGKVFFKGSYSNGHSSSLIWTICPVFIQRFRPRKDVPYFRISLYMFLD